MDLLRGVKSTMEAFGPGGVWVVVEVENYVLYTGHVAEDAEDAEAGVANGK